MRVVGSCARPPAPSALLFPHTAAGTTARLRRGRIAREPRAGRSEAGLELAFKDEVGPGHPAFVPPLAPAAPAAPAPNADSGTRDEVPSLPSAPQQLLYKRAPRAGPCPAARRRGRLRAKPDGRRARAQAREALAAASRGLLPVQALLEAPPPPPFPAVAPTHVPTVHSLCYPCRHF